MRTTLAVMITLLMALTGTASGAAEPEARGEGEPQGKLVISDSGLEYIDLAVGKGREAGLGDTATVHYTGWLQDGAKFDSSLDRGVPFSFRIGAGQVIQGWEEGVTGMRIGGKRKLFIPPHLGYGGRGSPGAIPPNAKLTFEVELLNLR